MKKIFIGSSGKAIEKAQLLRSILMRLNASVTCWKDSEAFPISNVTIDTLIEAAHCHDAAVFIFDKDDQIKIGEDEHVQYIPRDNVIAEAGMFAGVLGKEAVVLCTVSGIHEITDFKGITTLKYDPVHLDEMEKQLKVWLEKIKERRRLPEKNNVLLLGRRKMNEYYLIDRLLHISDGEFKRIGRIRFMNMCSNNLINPEVCDPFEFVSGDICLRDAVKKIAEGTNATVELMLLEPNEFILRDIETKIANMRAGSAAGALYSAWEGLYRNLSSETIYKQRFFSIPMSFHLYAMKTSMPFGIFNAEFLGDASKYNFIKVDLYSAALDNVDNRRSFIVWQIDDSENYHFFVDNYNSIKRNKQLCEKITIERLKEWHERWQGKK